MPFQPYRSPVNVADFIARLGSNRAEGMREQGDIAARGAQQVGQAIGQTATTIGDYYRMEPERRAQAEMRGLQKQQIEQQLKVGEGELATQARAVADRGALDTAMSTPGLDPDAIEAALPGHLKLTFRESWNKAESASAGLKKARTEAENAQNDYLGALAAGVLPFLESEDGGLSAAQTALAHAKQNGMDTKAIEAALQQNPAALPTIIEGLIAKSPTQQKLIGENKDRDLKTQQEARAAREAEAVKADRDADNARADKTLTEAERHNRVQEATARAAAARAGATAPVAVLGPDGKPTYVRPQDAVGRTPAAGTMKQSSGQEKRVLNFFNRARQADVDLERLESSLPKSLPGQTYMEWAPNFMQTEVGQQYGAAQRAFTEARLRKDSGAAIPDHEFANDRKTYFPQPGDSKATLEQKRRARATMLSSLAFESGQALAEYEGDNDRAKEVRDGYKAREAGQIDATKDMAPKNPFRK